MSETVSQYDSILDSVLAEEGMTHHYVHFWDEKQPGRIIVEPTDDHIITMRMQCRFFGFALPYSRNIEVARIESEPESVRPYSNGHFPRYNEVMEITVTAPMAKEPLMSIGQRISDRLHVGVDILRGY